MIRTVYADLLFLINFSMDFLCFFLVSRLFCRKLSMGRTVIASALGGVYAVFSLFLPFGGILLLLCDLLVCGIMCLIAEARRGMRMRRFLQEIVVYTGVSMALGGIMTALYSLLNEAGLPDALEGEHDGVSAWLFLLLALIGGGATLLGSRFFRRNTSLKRFLVTVSLCGRERTFRAMVDTGNALADPISGCPAAVLSRRAAKALFPSTVASLLDHPTECLTALPEEYRTRARLLAVKTVTGEGLLVAFRPDCCRITSADAPEMPGEACELLLAVTSVEEEEIDMLLPPGILHT